MNQDEFYNLFNEDIPTTLKDNLFEDWVFTMHSKNPFRNVFDVFYLLKMDKILDFDKESRYSIFQALLKEIELDAQESDRYGDSDSKSQGNNIFTDQIDL